MMYYTHCEVSNTLNYVKFIDNKEKISKDEKKKPLENKRFPG